MILQLKFIGILLLLLGFVHLIFPRMFEWKEELQRLSLVNRQMMIVHTFFVALTVFLLGTLCLNYPTELLTTRFGKVIATGIAIFFGIRFIVQFAGYSSKLWRGKTFETSAHIFFIALWGYLTGIFLFVGLT